jgi:hypothetical protein
MTWVLQCEAVSQLLYVKQTVTKTVLECRVVR